MQSWVEAVSLAAHSSPMAIGQEFIWSRGRRSAVLIDTGPHVILTLISLSDSEIRAQIKRERTNETAEEFGKLIQRWLETPGN